MSRVGKYIETMLISVYLRMGGGCEKVIENGYGFLIKEMKMFKS
jgi:hypothetical protein